MHFYRILDCNAEDGFIEYRATLLDAHAHAKRRFLSRHLARIELIDVDISKAGVLALLNGAARDNEPVLRTWGLTDRGGLRELAKGE